MKLGTKWAALAAMTLIAAGCAQPGSPTNAPTQAPASVAATGAATGAVPSPTAEPITPPTSLITAGKLVDCVDIEYPPMEYFPSSDVTDANLAIGFDVDGARAVAAKLGLAIEIRNTAFDALIADLGAGRCDIVWSALYVDPDRLKVADAVPYMATGHVVMVPAGNAKGIHTADDLCGKTISIQSGGVVEKASTAASKACTDAGKPAITIQGYKLVSDELQQIVIGRVDAVWETDTAVSDWLLKNPGKYEVAFAFPRDKNYGVYYGKGKTDLGTAITAALKAIKADGSLVAIAAKYQMDAATLDAIK